MALFSGAPGDDGSVGTELTGSGYSCQAITFGAPGRATGNAQQVANSNNIQFGPAAADWLQPVAFGIFDAMTNGDLLYWNTPRDSQGRAAVRLRPVRAGFARHRTKACPITF